MKKISFFFIIFLILFQTQLSAYSSDPRQFIEELINDAINRLSDKSLSQEEKVNFIY